MNKKYMKKYGATEKQIVRILSQLPSEFCLTFVKTEAQFNHWLDNRIFRSFVSDCWEALHQGKPSSIEDLLKSKEMDKLTYNQVICTTVFYERLWELIFFSFHFIEPVFFKIGWEYLVESPSKLFTSIISFDAHADFCVCLKGFHEFGSYQKLKKELDLTKKVCEGKANRIQLTNFEEAVKEEENLYKGEFNLPLWITVAICTKKATKRQSAIRNALNAFNVAMEEMIYLEVPVRRRGGSQQWQNGELLKAQVGGKYKET